MLLRWLLQQYGREAAEVGLRAVAGELKRGSEASGNGINGEEASLGKVREFAGRSGNELVAQSAEEGPSKGRSADDFLPCDAVFIFALGIESGGLVDLLKDAETSRHAHGVEHAGKLGGQEVVVVEGGVGQKAAARATAEAIKFYKPRRVLSAGFGGGLVDDLRRGHVLIANEIVNEAGERIEVDYKVEAESLAGAKGMHAGRLLTVDRILRDPAERRALAQRHGALACDMETFAVASVCKEQGVPLGAIRIISDAVDDQLPPEIEHLLTQTTLAGKLGAATGAILKRFSAAKDLWKLREDALKASDRLAQFLVRMLPTLPPQ